MVFTYALRQTEWLIEAAIVFRTEQSTLLQMVIHKILEQICKSRHRVNALGWTR